MSREVWKRQAPNVSAGYVFWHAILMDSPDIYETLITIRQAFVIRLGWPPEGSETARKYHDLAKRKLGVKRRSFRLMSNG